MRLTVLMPAVTLLVAAQCLLQGCSSTAPRDDHPSIVEHGQQAPVKEPVSSADERLPGQPQPYLQAPTRNIPQARHQSPAVVALLDQAEQQANAGELESAAASLERAIRIDPRNAVLWYHLATVRLSQGESSQAEQLAAKSNSLASGNHSQQARNWRLIAQARREQNNPRGAATAEQRARELDAR